MNTPRITIARMLQPGIAALLGTGILAACSTPASAPPTAAPVQLAVSANGLSPAASTASGLSITTVRLVLGRASLGAGNQFGCIDCHGNSIDTPVSPTVVTLAAGAGPATVATGAAQPGTYTAAELEVVQPSSPLSPSTPNATVEVTGTRNGTPFTVDVPAEGSFRETLSPPVTLTSGGSQPVTVAITLPVAQWFSNGTGVLDPSVTADRAQIVANVQHFFTTSAPEGIEAPESGG